LSLIPRVAVRAVICNEQGNILFLKRHNTKAALNQWCLPGGKVDFNHYSAMTRMKEIYQI
jgi:ADP-ribose pyrophosphatase YjhB (NUDIX family)